MTHSNPNPAWPLRSDSENAGRVISIQRVGTFAQKQHGAVSSACRGIDLAEALHAPRGHVVRIEIDLDDREPLALQLRNHGLSLADELLVCVEHLVRAQLPETRIVFLARPQDGLVDAVVHGDVLSVESRVPTVAEGAVSATAAPEACESDDPAIDEYIASDNRVIALTEKLIAHQRHLSQRMIIAEGKIENLLLRAIRPQR